MASEVIETTATEVTEVPVTGSVTLSAETAGWVVNTLFPPPDSGRQGIVINPGSPTFDEEVALIAKIRKEFGL